MMHSHPSARACPQAHVRYARGVAVPCMLFATALVLTACGSSDDDTADGGIETVDKSELVSSGTRIRARLAITDDGASELVGWYDGDRGVSCTFQEAADGVTRCLPEAKHANLFADAACTQPLSYAAACGEDPAMSRLSLTEDFADDSCGYRRRRTRVFEQGPAPTFTQPRYFKNVGSCDFLDASEPMFPMVEVPASAFAMRRVVVVER